MATGRAVITTDMPGCRDPIIDGESGIIIPPQDAASLATAMRSFIQNPEQAHHMGQKARMIAENIYDVAKVNDMITSHMGLQHIPRGPTRASHIMAQQI